MINKSAKKLDQKIDIKATHGRARKGDMPIKPRPPGEVDHHPRQRFVQRHVSMAITAHAALIANRLGKSLAERNPDIFNGVMRINLEITMGHDIEINQAVAHNLIQHMVQKRDASRE